MLYAFNGALQSQGWSCVDGQPDTTYCDGSWIGVQCESDAIVSLTLGSAYQLSLTGSIPSTIGLKGALLGLTLLQLSYNALTGILPTSIGYLANLNILKLNGNSIGGTLPTSIGNITALQSLNIAQNLLKGPIPRQVGYLTGLTALYLSANSLSQGLPVSLTKLTNLVKLYLSMNRLSGAIPSKISSLTALSYLSVQNNRLLQSLPSSIGLMTQLTSLALANNQLTGSVPSSFCKLNTGITLSLTGNKLACYDSCFLKNTANFKPQFVDFIYVLSACYTKSYYYASYGVTKDYATCPNFQSTWTTDNYCNFYKPLACVVNSKFVFSNTCPPPCLRTSPVTYCQTFAQLAYACTTTDKVASVNDVANLEKNCLTQFMQKLGSSTMMTVQFSFTMQSIDLDVLKAHQQSTDKGAYTSDKQNVIAAACGSMNTPISAINVSDVQLSISGPGSILAHDRKLSASGLGVGSVMVFMKIRMAAEVLRNVTIQNAGSTLQQFQKQVSMALNGTSGAPSAFTQVLRTRFIDGTSGSKMVLSESVTTRNTHSDANDLKKVSIFTASSGNKPANSMVGAVGQLTSNPTAVPTSTPSSLPSASPTTKTYPSKKPTASPSKKPSTVKPTAKPSSSPSTKPTATPIVKPTVRPSVRPSAKPSKRPSSRPTTKPK